MKRNNLSHIYSYVVVCVVDLFFLCVVLMPFLLNRKVAINEKGEESIILRGEESVTATFFPKYDNVENISLFYKNGLNDNLYIKIYDTKEKEIYYEKCITLKNDVGTVTCILEKSFEKFKDREIYIDIQLLDNNGNVELITSTVPNKNSHVMKNGEWFNEVSLALTMCIGLNYVFLRNFIFIFVCINLILVLTIHISEKQTSKKLKWKKSNIIAIIRLFAAIGVLTVHLSQTMGTKNELYKFFDVGRHGVEIFMLISGFLIMFSLEKNEHVSAFYVKRLSKIIPDYYTMLVIAILYINITNTILPPDNIGWSRYFLFLSTILPAEDSFWCNFGATWSVSSFVLFYLLAPLIKRIIGTFKKAWNLLVVLSFFRIGIYILNFYGYFVNPELDFSPFLHIVYFIFGVCIYYAIQEKKEESFIKRIGIFLFLMFVITEVYNFAIVSRFCFAAIGSILILLLYNKQINNKIVIKISELSKYSYALYITHPLVLFIFPRFRYLYSNNVFYVISMILMIFIFTYLMYHLVEYNCSALGNKMANWKR